VRPIERLVGRCVRGEHELPTEAWLGLFRDQLPPWHDTVLGTVGGGIGETCTVALVLGGLYLMYRGFLRWQGVVAALLAGATFAAVLPVRLGGEWVWLPALIGQEAFPAGTGWVLFQLTGGGFLLSVLIFGADPMTSPLTTRGHVAFAIGIGALTMAARWFGITPGSSYWAVLAMNTLVPLIDTCTRIRTPRR
jgi:electron transport complex protein RnfD